MCSIDVQATKQSVRLFYQGFTNEGSDVYVYPQLLAQVSRSPETMSVHAAGVQAVGCVTAKARGAT